MRYFLDIEYTGPKHSCAIYEIAAVRESDGQAWHRFIRFDTTAYAACPGAPDIDQEFLEQRGACDPRDAARNLVAWMEPDAVLVAHDAFRSDQPVLERFLYTYLDVGDVPTDWTFEDSLLHFRATARLRSYTLENVARAFLTPEFSHEFSALEDAQTLYDLLRGTEIRGSRGVPFGERSVRVVPGIGHVTEMALLHKHGVDNLRLLRTFMDAAAPDLRPESLLWLAKD